MRVGRGMGGGGGKKGEGVGLLGGGKVWGVF